MTDREFAPAKVNLALHVTGRRADGYHLLDSLVVFPGVGDDLEASLADNLSLSVEGPHADGLDGADNLVLRAARLFESVGAGARISLYKKLPVASGVGGGSSDAAATLRLLSRLWGVPLPSQQRILSLGADVPVCLAGVPARMSGIGDLLEPIHLPSFSMVLVNPGIQVSTQAVFQGLESRDNPALSRLPALGNVSDMCRYLNGQRNDLEQPAVKLCPAIGGVLEALRARPGCGLSRMSGSGATCFGVFADRNAANDARRVLSGEHPDWWVQVAESNGHQRAT